MTIFSQLCANPSLRARINRNGWPGGIQELLKFDAVFVGIEREKTVDIELPGTRWSTLESYTFSHKTCIPGIHVGRDQRQHDTPRLDFTTRSGAAQAEKRSRAGPIDSTCTLVEYQFQAQDVLVERRCGDEILRVNPCDLLVNRRRGFFQLCASLFHRVTARALCSAAKSPVKATLGAARAVSSPGKIDRYAGVRLIAGSAAKFDEFNHA